MQIRTKLSLYFTLISAVLLLLVLLAINLLYIRHTKEDFFRALKERAIVTAQVYLEADEISDSSLQHFKEEYLNTLPDEVIKMYDSANRPAFIKDTGYSWNADTINLVHHQKYFEYKEGQKAVVGIRYDDNQGSFVILVSAMDRQGKEREQMLLRSSITIYFLELLILFLAGQWFARQVLAPVKKINEQMHRITATDLHLRVDKGRGKDEISELATNFNLLLQRLESSFEMQKTFVANASHELRTPLTSMIGEIEVVTSQTRTGAEYHALLLSVLTEAEKLNNVIEGLLSLASAENMIAVQTTEEVRVDELLWDLQAHFAKHHPPSVLHIHLPSLPEDENLLCIKANRNLLLMALNNIIKNAFKFSHNQPVDCALQHNAQGLHISISDHGIGMMQDVEDKIFQPFYRSTQAQSFEGQGLGLFIAKKIIDLYKGKITVQSMPAKGTTINILFAGKNSF